MQVVCQNRNVAVALHLGSDHFVVSDPDLPPDRAVSRAERAESGCTGPGSVGFIRSFWRRAPEAPGTSRRAERASSGPEGNTGGGDPHRNESARMRCAHPRRGAFMSRYSGIAALLVAYLACPLAWSQESSPPKDVFGPDSLAQPGVPEGKIQEFHAPDSRTFPGFVHDWWLYIPAQYTPAKPAALMIFQDGADFVKRDGHWRLPVVLDNLIAHGDLPVIAAVFVNPGASIGHRDGKPINSNRSVEYDTLSPAYATFLWNEI